MDKYLELMINRKVTEVGNRFRNEFTDAEAFNIHMEKYRHELIKLFSDRELLSNTERKTRLIELSEQIHAITKAAGLTEEDIRKAVNNALAD